MPRTMDRSAFLKAYNFEEDAIKNSGLTWEELIEIYHKHSASIATLEATAKYVADRLQQIGEVHSLKWRIKDPEHLLEKIIRKKLKDPTREITPDNYAEQITDLIGLRALHLFKGDWETIHDFVVSTWSLKEPPTANIRKGDPEPLLEQFKKRECKISEHPRGYRSIHYLIKSQPSKNEIIAELQVRTIFEEGWAEIDHRISYPNDLANVVLGDFSVIFNRLAGSADEMGTFIKQLRDDLNNREIQSKVDLEAHKKKVIDLKKTIKKLKISGQEKQQIKKELKAIETPFVNASSLTDSLRLFQERVRILTPQMQSAFVNAQSAIRDSLKSVDDNFLRSATVKPLLQRTLIASPKSEQYPNPSAASSGSPKSSKPGKPTNRRATKRRSKGVAKKLRNKSPKF